MKNKKTFEVFGKILARKNDEGVWEPTFAGELTVGFAMLVFIITSPWWATALMRALGVVT